MTTRCRGEAGQALVQVALSMMVLLALLALIIDVGWLYADRRQAQNAADAAALAGAQALCDKGSSAARSAASSFTAKNLDSNLDPEVDITVNSSAGTVAVDVYLQRETLLGRLLDEAAEESEPSAHAVAECTSNSGSGIYPIATRERAGGFTIGQTYEIREGQSAGNFGWLRWSGQNSSSGTLCSNLSTPRGGEPLYSGDWIYGATGNMNSSCVRNELDDRIDSREPVIVLVFDGYSGTGSNLQYHVAGYAEFVLTDYDLTGNDKAIYGRFNRWVTVPTGTDIDQASGAGTTLRLIE
jgi:hypothetical protein